MTCPKCNFADCIEEAGPPCVCGPPQRVTHTKHEPNLKEKKMAKWQVKYELRDYYSRTVEAETAEEAEEIICNECWRRHRSDVYTISETKRLASKEKKDDKQDG